uniref:COMM domain-containing protein 3 n=1 Tax=Peronospora matthiolae TaxID=2874970 RepID=A0AAV1TI37_9STRA
MTTIISDLAGPPSVSFLVSNASVVPRSSLTLLSSLPATSLEELAHAAVSELTTTGLNLSSSQQVVDEKLWTDTEAFAAMCVIIAVWARDGDALMLIEQRRQQLEALGVDDTELQTKLLSVIPAAASRVRRVLDSTNFDFAQVVDVSWRLDYVVRSSGAGSVQEPLYFVQLYVQSPRPSGDVGLQTVVLTCSVEELRVLVYRIQEAANEVEKLMTGTPSQFRQRTSA